MNAPIDYLSQMDENTRTLIRMALDEDRVEQDYTTLWSIPEKTYAHAHLISKQFGVFCGGALFAAVFQAVDPAIQVQLRAAEGEKVEKGQIVAEISGRARPLLGAERTALNLMGRLSGISTLTARYVETVAGTGARICDTRKTTPLWRRWEKYAVTQGGGVNHRFNLSDQILLKDNHISVSENVSEAYSNVKKNNLIGIPMEVEVDTLDQLKELLPMGVERVLLDNMTLGELKEAVVISAGKTVLEASGGVNSETVRAIAETGVDYISIGALTHSVVCFDFSLEIALGLDDHLDKSNPAVM